MASRAGDRARFNRRRKKFAKNRAKIREFAAKLAADAAEKKTAA